MLLEEAKKAAPDDPIVAAIKPATPGPSDVYVKEASGGLAGKTLQLWLALRRPSASSQDLSVKLSFSAMSASRSALCPQPECRKLADRCQASGSPMTEITL